MRALIAEHDRQITSILVQTLEGWGADVTVAQDGPRAWDALDRDHGIGLAVLDYDLPKADGQELCRKIRQHEAHADLYLLLVTARNSRADLAAGLDAGADDYLAKPLDPLELRARINTALRVVTFQDRLMETVLARTQSSPLEPPGGLLAVCSYCKNVRGGDEWEDFEHYLSQRTHMQFSHGVCPDCYKAVVARLKHR